GLVRHLDRRRLFLEGAVMTVRAPASASFVAAVSLVVTGCASTSEYARFAQAGSAYAAALDHLLVAARPTGIDATSQRPRRADAGKNQDLGRYQALAAIDTARLATIGRLRTHAHLLALYFGLLNALATSDAPERLSASIGGVADSLNSLGNQLRAGPFVPR